MDEPFTQVLMLAIEFKLEVVQHFISTSDGQKRTGLAVMLTYLEIQGITIAKFLIIYHNRSYGILNRF